MLLAFQRVAAPQRLRLWSLNKPFRSFSSPAMLRNVGIIAHVDAGKTTTTERMLRLSGAVNREGRVDNGDTITDFLVQERERGITIQSAAVHFKWRDHTICLIDTPGHVDFTIEVERSLRVLDGVAIVIDAVAGVQAQTETVWKQASNYDLPALAFINKMDRDGADFGTALKSLTTRLGIDCLPLQMPIIKNEVTVGYVDLLAMDFHVWQSDSSPQSDVNLQHQNAQIEVTKFEDYPNEGLKRQALEARSILFDQLSDHDDEFCEEMLELMESEEIGAAPSLPSIIAAVKRVCNLSATCDENEGVDSMKRRVVPCLMGASLRGIGVEALLDASVAFLPNPAERPAPFVMSPQSSKSSSSASTSSLDSKKKQLSVSPEDPLCALAFKVSNDTHRGALVYLRVYAGTLKKGQVLQCGGGVGSGDGEGVESKGYKERMTHLLKPFGDELVPVGEEGVGPGDTVVAVGLKKTVTGDSIVAYKGPLHGYTLSRIPIPHPVFALGVYPTNSMKAKPLEEALQIMSRDDPSLVVGPDPENTDELLMQGMGELHLDVACSRLKTEFGIDVTTGRMRIAYREALSDLPLSINKFVYDRTVGEVEKEKRLFVGYSVTLTSHSLEDSRNKEDGKYSMKPATVSIAEKARKELGNLEKSEMVKKAFEDSLLYGPLHGFPLTGFHLEVTDAEIDSDTNPTSLKQGAQALIRRLMKLTKGADVLLLQPMMALEVSTPEDNMGNVLTDLTVGREATIKSVEVIGSGVNVRHIIKSDAPLSKLLGFSTDLRSLTSGEGLFSMEYSHHSVIDKLPEEDVRLSA